MQCDTDLDDVGVVHALERVALAVQILLDIVVDNGLFVEDLDGDLSFASGRAWWRSVHVGRTTVMSGAHCPGEEPQQTCYPPSGR